MEPKLNEDWPHPSAADLVDQGDDSARRLKVQGLNPASREDVSVACAYRRTPTSTTWPEQTTRSRSVACSVPTRCLRAPRSVAGREAHVRDPAEESHWRTTLLPRQGAQLAKDVCWPAQREQLGQELEERGFIAIQRRGQGKPRIYELNLTVASGKERPRPPKALQVKFRRAKFAHLDTQSVAQLETQNSRR